MKKVLIAVIGANMRPYPMLMKAQMETWASRSVPGVDTLFYSTPMTPAMPGVLILEMPDGYYQMGRKNLAMFPHALKRDWDYMARVNASCYVLKAKLLEYVQSLPDSNLFRGIYSNQHGFMWGGGQYIFSRDVVQKMADHANLWDHTVMEDDAFSRFARKLGIPLDKDGRFASINRHGDGWLLLNYNAPPNQSGPTFKDFNELKTFPLPHFIRVKQDGKRHEDVEIMHKLFALGL